MSILLIFLIIFFFPRFDDSATPPQVNVNEDLAVGETVVNVKAIPGLLEPHF